MTRKRFTVPLLIADCDHPSPSYVDIEWIGTPSVEQASAGEHTRIIASQFTVRVFCTDGYSYSGWDRDLVRALEMALWNMRDYAKKHEAARLLIYQAAALTETA